MGLSKIFYVVVQPHAADKTADDSEVIAFLFSVYHGRLLLKQLAVSADRMQSG
jgi:hypothetical protein